MNRKFRAGVIGCGNIGSLFDDINNKWTSSHCGVYSKLKETELVCVYDINKELLKKCKKKWKKEAYISFKTFIDQKLDIISICTPNDSHLSLVEKIIRSKQIPKAILCEKPLGKNINDAKKIVSLCKKNKIILAVNHVRRYDKLYEFIKKNLKKLIGEVQSITFYYTGGVITTGSHMFDLLNFYLGVPKEIFAFNNKNIKSYEPILDGMVIYEKNKIAHIIGLDSNNFSSFELHFLGTKAKLELINTAFGDYNYRYFKKQKDKILPNAKYIINKTSKPIKLNMPRDFMENAVLDIIKSIKTKKKPLSSGEDAILALKLINAALHSSKTNRFIKLNDNIKNYNLTVKGGLFKK